MKAYSDTHRRITAYLIPMIIKQAPRSLRDFAEHPRRELTGGLYTFVTLLAGSETLAKLGYADT